MLKNYEQFLKENRKISENVDHTDAFDEIAEYLLDINETSFSYIAKSGSATLETDKRLDLASKKHIDYLNGKYGEEVMKEYVKMIIESDMSGYGNTNALNDIIFYNYDNNFLLGGYDIAAYDTIIKYSYGWHTTKYGKLAIAQSFSNMNDYKDAAIKSIEEEINMMTSSKNLVYKTLIFITDGDLDSDLDSVLSNIITGYGDKFLKGRIVDTYKNNDKENYIVELYFDNYKLTDEDWMTFFNKMVDSKIPQAIKFDWYSILKDHTSEGDESLKNTITSIKALGKFGI